MLLLEIILNELAHCFLLHVDFIIILSMTIIRYCCVLLHETSTKVEFPEKSPAVVADGGDLLVLDIVPPFI